MNDTTEHTVTDLAPQSSVQIETRVKGPPAVTVKAYASSIWVAADLAIKTYRYTIGQLQEPDEEDDE